MSLRVYSDHYKRLPYPEVTPERARPIVPALSPLDRGKTLYSWRVAIIQDLTGWDGTYDPSRPWDDPANKQLVELSSFYAYNVLDQEAETKTFPDTDVLAITGPGTAFGDGTEPPMAMTEVPPQTILVVETRASGIPWPAPGDFDIRTMPRIINSSSGKGISSRQPGGFLVIFADASVWLLSDKVPFETLSQFFKVEDARKHDRDSLLGPFALHRGP